MVPAGHENEPISLLVGTLKHRRLEKHLQLNAPTLNLPPHQFALAMKQELVKTVIAQGKPSGDMEHMQPIIT